MEPRPRGKDLSADKKTSQDPDTKGAPRRDAPPGHGPPPRLRPTFRAMEREGWKRDASHSPGECGRGEVPAPKNPGQRRGVSPPRATQPRVDPTVTGGPWRRAGKPPLRMVPTLLMVMALVATSAGLTPKGYRLTTGEDFLFDALRCDKAWH